MYSAIRDSLLLKLNKRAISPVFTSESEKDIPEEILSSADELGIRHDLYVTVLTFQEQCLLDIKLSAVFKKSEDGKMNYFLNGDADLAGWLISHGIIDGERKPIFSELDAKEFSQVYSYLIYYLAWCVLEANGFTPKSQQALVGNSEETKQ